MTNSSSQTEYTTSGNGVDPLSPFACLAHMGTAATETPKSVKKQAKKPRKKAVKKPKAEVVITAAEAQPTVEVEPSPTQAEEANTPETVVAQTAERPRFDIGAAIEADAARPATCFMLLEGTNTVCEGIIAFKGGGGDLKVFVSDHAAMPLGRANTPLYSRMEANPNFVTIRRAKRVRIEPENRKPFYVFGRQTAKDVSGEEFYLHVCGKLHFVEESYGGFNVKLDGVDGSARVIFGGHDGAESIVAFLDGHYANVYYADGSAARVVREGNTFSIESVDALGARLEVVAEAIEESEERENGGKMFAWAQFRAISILAAYRQDKVVVVKIRDFILDEAGMPESFVRKHLTPVLDRMAKDGHIDRKVFRTFLSPRTGSGKPVHKNKDALGVMQTLQALRR
jgi:hypothetical protein